MFDAVRILLVGAHPDDIELGCGGTVAKIKDGEQTRIHCLVFSDRMDNMVPRDLKEMYCSLQVLGIPSGAVDIRDFPTRVFTGYRQPIRDAMLEVRNRFRPEVVFCHSTRDLHQDHQVISEEAGRIFRSESLLGYEVIRSSHHFDPNLFIKLQPEHLRRKIRALHNYRSQAEGGQSAGYYFKPNVIRSWAVFRGAHAGSSLAEAFEVYRLTC